MNLREKIKLIFAIPKITSNWVKALDLSSKGCFKEALELLQENEQASAGSDVEYHLLRGFAYWRIGDYGHAIEDARTATSLIPTKRRYNVEEKKYLLAHAQITWAGALSDQGKEAECMNILRQCDIPAINLSRVSKAIRLSFPLSEHPSWKG